MMRLEVVRQQLSTQAGYVVARDQKNLLQKISHQWFAGKLFSALNRQNNKLIHRVLENLRGELEKHQEAHRVLEKMRYNSTARGHFQPSQL